MNKPNKFDEGNFEEKIEVGATPRQYAPGSVVDVDEVVAGTPETDHDLAATDPNEIARQDDLTNRVKPVQKQVINGKAGEEGEAVERNRLAHEREFAVTHNEEAIPNYRDETYRDPGETPQEGQSAEKYDQQKRAVADGSRFIPPNS